MPEKGKFFFVFFILLFNSNLKTSNILTIIDGITHPLVTNSILGYMIVDYKYVEMFPILGAISLTLVSGGIYRDKQNRKFGELIPNYVTKRQEFAMMSSVAVAALAAGKIVNQYENLNLYERLFLGLSLALSVNRIRINI